MSQKLAVGGLLAVSAGLFCWLVLGPWLGVRWNTPYEVHITFICTETNETFELVPQAEPAENPKTGRRTLVRAQRAADGQGWTRAAPDDVLRQQRRANAKP